MSPYHLLPPFRYPLITSKMLFKPGKETNKTKTKLDQHLSTLIKKLEDPYWSMSNKNPLIYLKGEFFKIFKKYFSEFFLYQRYKKMRFFNIHYQNKNIFDYNIKYEKSFIYSSCT